MSYLGLSRSLSDRLLVRLTRQCRGETGNYVWGSISGVVRRELVPALAEFSVRKRQPPARHRFRAVIKLLTASLSLYIYIYILLLSLLLSFPRRGTTKRGWRSCSTVSIAVLREEDHPCVSVFLLTSVWNRRNRCIKILSKEMRARKELLFFKRSVFFDTKNVRKREDVIETNLLKKKKGKGKRKMIS